MNREQPQLLYVAGLGSDHPNARSMAAQLVERGIYFQFDENQDLPSALSDDLTPYKAVLLDAAASSTVASDRAALARLERYVAAGGLLFKSPSGEIAGRDHGYYTNLFSDLLTHHEATHLIAHAALTEFHPVMERIQLARSDDAMLTALKARVMERLANMRNWGEFTLHYWKAAVALIEAGHDDVRPALAEAVRATSETMTQGYIGDHVSGLFGTAWLHRETGETGPLEKARAVLDRVIRDRPRSMGVINFNGFATDPLGRNYTASRNLGDDWGFGTISQRLVNWNEALHMLCPSLAAMSRVTGDRRYLAEALHLIRHCARYHVGENGLLFHASREGRPIAGRWGRGHTHALYGALYTLEEMDPQDPERETILDFLRRVGCGLRGFQDQRTGLWRNDVDVPQARLESSCTCGIVAVYGRCIRESWLARDEFLDMILKGWEGLKRMYWRGGLCAQCRGTGVGPDSYYLARPHGWQVVPQMVMAGAEIGRLREA